MEMFDLDANWIEQNYEYLQENYPDTWIAVKNGKVLGYGFLSTIPIDVPNDCFLEFIPAPLYDIEENFPVVQIR